MSDERTDHDLLSAARAGDSRALEALLERHQARVYRFGLKMCRNPDDARDVLQDTLLAMARGVRDFRGASSLSTWLYTIARSHCIKRRRHPADTQEPTAEVPSTALPPDEALAGKELERALEQAIASLEHGSREVLLLRDIEGLTAPEVAEVLGITTDAVKSRLHRARLMVRERIAPMLEVPPPGRPPTCPDALALFTARLEGEISPADCAAMDAHLSTCRWCRGDCESFRRTLALCKPVTQGALPPELAHSVRDALAKFVSENR